MKTSIILMVLLIFNTTALISSPLANLLHHTNPWIFVGIEVLLVLVFLIHKIVKDISKTMDVDCNDLKLYLTKYKK